MSNTPTPLPYHELDEDLVVWGNARNGRVMATGFGDEGHELAEARWDPADSATGDLVYHHPDRGWMNAATGREIAPSREEPE